MDAARRTGDIVVPPLQMARTMLSWRVYVGAATEDGEMHDPPMRLARNAMHDPPMQLARSAVFFFYIIIIVILVYGWYRINIFLYN